MKKNKETFDDVAKKESKKAANKEIINDDDKLQKLEGALADIEKRFGKGSMFRLGDKPIGNFPHIPTGLLEFDVATGIGGLPRGRMVEIFGPESSGKTSLCLAAIAQVQKAGGKAAFLDMEHALEPEHVIKLGVNINDLLVAQPDNGEECLEICESLTKSGAFDIIVIDSVAALVPKAEIEGDMGDSVPGDTPILIRDKKSKKINIVSIASLYGGMTSFYKNQHTHKYRKTKNIEVMTASGWRQLKAVFYKENVKLKPIIYTNTLIGLAATTPDHSLFRDGKEVKPDEIIIGDTIDHTQNIPDQPTKEYPNKDIAWILGYFCAEGSLPPRLERFNVCDTKKEIIDLFEEKLDRNFYSHKKLYIRRYDKEINNRKDLYVLNVSRCPELQNLIKDCVDQKTGFKKVPSCILNSNKDIMREFLEGYKTGDGVISREGYSLSTSSFLMVSGVTYLFNKLGIKYHIGSNIRDDRNNLPEFSINEVKNNAGNPFEVRKQTTWKRIPEYLYDLETEDGTFAGGAGFIIHHNSHMGLHARLMSQACRKLVGIIYSTNTTVVFTNQIRMKIGVMFGSPETQTGGNALKFYASMRIDVRKIESLKEGGKDSEHDPHGIRVKAKIIKNKVAPPFRSAEYDLLFDTGFDFIGSTIDLAVKHDLIAKGGSWYSYNSEKIGQGKASVIEFMKENPDLYDKIHKQVLYINDMGPNPDPNEEKKE